MKRLALSLILIAGCHAPDLIPDRDPGADLLAEHTRATVACHFALLQEREVVQEVEPVRAAAAVPTRADHVAWQIGSAAATDRPFLILFGSPGAVWSNREVIEFVGCTFTPIREPAGRQSEWQAALTKAKEVTPSRQGGALEGEPRVAPPCFIVCSPELEFLSLAVRVPSDPRDLLTLLEEICDATDP